MATVLITGGTGMIGKAIAVALLKRNYEVIILSRGKKAKNGTRQLPARNAGTSPGLSFALWDIDKQIIDQDAFAKADCIIHLAGANVGEKRWTKKRKEEIVKSRVDSGKLIADSVRNLPNKVKVIAGVSGIGWYGPDPVIPNPDPFREDASPHEDFLGATCKQWEDALAPVALSGIRLVTIRAGVVLSNDGGALKEFLKPLKFGLATILGNGRQIISWIHITDLVRMYVEAIENPQMQGVFNAVSPHPVSNKQFVIQMAKSRSRFYVPVHVPSFALKFVFGELSIEVLKSATISCEKIEMMGFVFRFPSLKEAFGSLFSTPCPPEGGT